MMHAKVECCVDLMIHTNCVLICFVLLTEFLILGLGKMEHTYSWFEHLRYSNGQLNLMNCVDLAEYLQILTRNLLVGQTIVIPQAKKKCKI